MHEIGTKDRGRLSILYGRNQFVNFSKSVKRRSASAKQHSHYGHQNFTEAVHATICDNKIEKNDYIF